LARTGRDLLTRRLIPRIRTDLKQRLVTARRERLLIEAAMKELPREDDRDAAGAALRSVAVHSAVRRDAIYNSRMAAIVPILLLGLFAVVALVVVATTLPLALAGHRAAATVMLVLLSTGPVLTWFGVLGVYATDWRKQKPTSLVPVALLQRFRIALGIAGVSLLLPILAVSAAVSRASRAGWEDVALLEASAVTVTLLLLLAVVVCDRVGRWLVTRVEAPHPLDHLIPAMTQLIADMAELTPAWNRPDVSRYLIHRVEAAARRLRSQPLTARAPLPQWRLRAEARESTERLAALIRMHKSRIAGARSKTEYEQVIASLISGLAAMANDDWDAMLAHAKPISSQPWYKRWPTRNLIPALILGIAAIALPWLPPFHGTRIATLGIRVTLGVYALLRLIPTFSMADTVDKALSRGFEGAKGK
jgi:hypothetical protein